MVEVLSLHGSGGLPLPAAGILGWSPAVGHRRAPAMAAT